jgi:hypothetical protein
MAMPVIINGRSFELASRLAQQLGVPRQTIHSACKRGLITSITLGKYRLIDVAEAHEFVRKYYRRDVAERMRRVWRKRKQKSKVKEK